MRAMTCGRRAVTTTPAAVTATRRDARATVGRPREGGGSLVVTRAVGSSSSSTTTAPGVFEETSALKHARIDNGSFGRGLFANGDGEVLASVPIDALACAPAAAGERLPAADEERIRSVYEEGWSRYFDGVRPPKNIVDFVLGAPFAKDVRLTVMLAWATAEVEAWREYGARVVPKEFDCMYLANEEELKELQDPEVRVMAERSKAGYEATWKAAMEAFPDVAETLAGVDAAKIEWCRAWVHTRAISGKIGETECAFLAPIIDLANHRVESTATYGLSDDGSSFQLKWNPKSKEGATPQNAEVFISYGDGLNNTILMLHYGFIDDNNRNERLPMEFIIPGARKVAAPRVIEACEALKSAGDEEASLAGANLLAMAARGPPPGVDPASEPPTTNPEVIQAMRDAVHASLSAAETTIQQDEALLQSSQIHTPRVSLAIRHRLARKRRAEAYLRFLDVLN